MNWLLRSSVCRQSSSTLTAAKFYEVKAKPCEEREIERVLLNPAFFFSKLVFNKLVIKLFHAINKMSAFELEWNLLPN